ncbi:MAG: DNA-binding response regulator [Elusimicrobia bacterium HGW-Elusimicrobia-3]|nr:MAG: DNA-binding response regulator [Elusimicrobia bacterium HGW-Elusimicrobia-3]
MCEAAASVMSKKNQDIIRVFLIDHHPVVREGVRACLTGQGGFSLVGEASDDKEALRKLRKAAPEIVILDVNLPGLDGGRLVRQLTQTVPGVKIIVFSIHASQEYAGLMARHGAHGFVAKDQPIARLVEAIRRVRKGGLFFPAGTADASLVPDASPSDPALTTRELEVLSLIVEGLANKEVGRKLGISVRTAETHRQHLIRKLGINSVSGLTKYAIQHGLTALG